jgi:hypothetical protein
MLVGVRHFRFLILVIAAVIGVHGSVQASCGDHVIVGKEQAAPKTPSQSPATPLPITPKLPCHGPACSGRPHLPPVAPVTTVSPPTHEWAVAVMTVTTSGMGDGEPMPVSESAKSIHMPCSIFHPPRSASA